MKEKIKKGFLWLDRSFHLEHLWPFLIYSIIYMIWFHILEVVPRHKYLTIIVPLDRKIPFLECFVVPYLSWFGYIFIGTILLYYKDRDMYDRLITSMMIVETLFLLISTFLPNRQPLRLLEMPRDNVFTHLVAYVWKSDSPTNVFPSLHVFNAIAMTIALVRSRWKFTGKKWADRFIIVWCVLICLATVFIKQHSVCDGIASCLLIIWSWFYVERRGHVFRFTEWDKKLVDEEEKIFGKRTDDSFLLGKWHKKMDGTGLEPATPHT